MLRIAGWKGIRLKWSRNRREIIRATLLSRGDQRKKAVTIQWDKCFGRRVSGYCRSRCSVSKRPWEGKYKGLQNLRGKMEFKYVNFPWTLLKLTGIVATFECIKKLRLWQICIYNSFNKPLSSTSWIWFTVCRNWLRAFRDGLSPSRTYILLWKLKELAYIIELVFRRAEISSILTWCLNKD